MRVLITGRQGQVVRSLLERGQKLEGAEWIALGRPELDLERPGSAASAVVEVKPDVVVSVAAYTAVDQAEDEPERAFQVNGEAPGELAAAARAIGAPIIHLSTDYVFDGSKAEPYLEEDHVGPIGAYGRSKLRGEVRVRDATPDHLILRTAWVYSPWGKNFVKTMMSLAGSRDAVNVVSDQHGSPTSALDVADGLITILSRWRDGKQTGFGGTYHLAGTGVTHWCGLAAEVFAQCRRLRLPTAIARPITTADFPTRAKRPVFSILDSSRFASDFGYRSPDWQESVAEVVQRLAVGDGARTC